MDSSLKFELRVGKRATAKQAIWNFGDCPRDDSSLTMKAEAGSLLLK